MTMEDRVKELEEAVRAWSARGVVMLNRIKALEKALRECEVQMAREYNHVVGRTIVTTVETHDVQAYSRAMGAARLLLEEKESSVRIVSRS